LQLDGVFFVNTQSFVLLSSACTFFFVITFARHGYYSILLSTFYSTLLQQVVSHLNRPKSPHPPSLTCAPVADAPVYSADELGGIVPVDARKPFDVRDVSGHAVVVVALMFEVF
jgi:hypothetical protein